MPNIKYRVGDATIPYERPNILIAHICNDLGWWGAGFSGALSHRFPITESMYRTEMRQNPLALGSVQFIRIEHHKHVVVANMIAQHGVYHHISNPHPIRYDALRTALQHVAAYALRNGMSVQMPRIGTGLAGGSWSYIAALIARELLDRGVEVFVFRLPANPR